MGEVLDMIVMGDGIAGRAMAVGLAQSGMRVKVVAPPSDGFERGGVQLAPNGWSALGTLGLLDEATSYSCPLAMMRLLSVKTGHSLAEIDLTARHRRPYGGIGRQDLLAVLGDAAKKTGRVEWHHGEGEHITTHSEHAELTLSDGSVVSAPFVIGADGTMGLARRFVMAEEDGDGGASADEGNGADGNDDGGGADNKRGRACPRRAFRSDVSLSDLPAYFGARATSVWLGDGGHMVFYPLLGGRLNMVVVTASGASSRAQALSLVEGQALLRPLLPFVEKASDFPLYRHGRLDVLRRGRVILAGDAAHPMPPHLAQGAGQSLIDGASLKLALADCGGADLSELLTTWTAKRLRATRQIQDKAEGAGRMFAVDGAMTRLRNLGLSSFGGRVMERTLDKIWSS